MSQYIKLEDVQQILERNKINHTNNKWETTLSISPNCIEEINSLPSINPEEMIEEIMTDESQYFIMLWRKLALKEL